MLYSSAFFFFLMKDDDQNYKQSLDDRLKDKQHLVQQAPSRPQSTLFQLLLCYGPKLMELFLCVHFLAHSKMKTSVLTLWHYVPLIIISLLLC